jgi:serine/threonine protein kinase
MGTSIHLGDFIDHYRLDSLIANSGTASLFRATDTRTGDVVALKIPYREPVGLSAFATGSRSEASICGRLSHPGIARVLEYESGSHPYAVIEWAAGRSLRQMLDDQPRLSVELSLELAIRICDVLDYIHRQGIIHLDLKPENVIVDSDNEIKLVDFGLARQIRRGFWSLMPYKATGTPDYASPEQIARKFNDARSDIYSLGLMLYEMLTGELPFSGVSPAAALQLRIGIDSPPPQHVNPCITPELNDLVCRTIARNPASRPRSARELSSQLERIRCEVLSELVPSV